MTVELSANGSKSAGLVFEDPGNERAVLATILTVPNAINDVYGVIKASDFLTPHNRHIFVCLEQLLITQGMCSFDITAVVNKLSSLGLLEKCGGYDYIDALFSTKVLYENLDKYLNSVLENSSKKRLYDRLGVLQEQVVSNVRGSEVKSSGQLIKEAEDEISEVLAYSSRLDEAVDIASDVDGYIKGLIDNPMEIRGIPTGFKILDSKINGLLPGSLTILAARAKTGKSVCLLGWAKYIAFNLGIPILYIDTEMSTEEQMSRLLSNMSGVKERSISNGSFAGDDRHLEAVMNASSEIKKHKNFYHKYLPGVSVENVIRLTKKYRHQKNIGALFFDYIKLTDSSLLKNNMKEYQALGYMTATLKDLAGTLNIPVITAAQVSREGAEKGFLQSNMIADSDRLLRYCNNLLGLCMKTKDEVSKLLGQNNDFRSVEANGTHRLQVLETRAGGTFQRGINITFRKQIIRMEESFRQLETGDDGSVNDGSDFI